MKKLVSVIIPTYSRPTYLVRSVRSVLNQTYSCIEVLVIDDNNPNTQGRRETEAVMRQFKNDERVRYIQHPKNLNGSAARNTGIANSKGEYIALLDDDDEFLPQKIELQVKKLEDLDDSWGGCYCSYQFSLKSKPYRKIEKLEEGNLLESLLLIKNSICGGSTLMIRKSVFEELQGFDTSFRRYQDWEFLVRFFRRYKLAQSIEVLTNINMDSRINAGSAKNAIEFKEKFLNEFEKDIDKLPNRNLIYKTHWFLVANLLFEKRSYSLAIQMLNRAKTYSPISFRDIAYCIFNIIEGIIPVKKLIQRRML